MKCVQSPDGITRSELSFDMRARLSVTLTTRELITNIRPPINTSDHRYASGLSRSGRPVSRLRLQSDF
jgi:hypothetical protein